MWVLLSPTTPPNINPRSWLYNLLVILPNIDSLESLATQSQWRELWKTFKQTCKSDNQQEEAAWLAKLVGRQSAVLCGRSRVQAPDRTKEIKYGLIAAARGAFTSGRSISPDSLQTGRHFRSTTSKQQINTSEFILWSIIHQCRLQLSYQSWISGSNARFFHERLWRW